MASAGSLSGGQPKQQQQAAPASTGPAPPPPPGEPAPPPQPIEGRTPAWLTRMPMHLIEALGCPSFS